MYRRLLSFDSWIGKDFSLKVIIGGPSHHSGTRIASVNGLSVVVVYLRISGSNGYVVSHVIVLPARLSRPDIRQACNTPSRMLGVPSVNDKKVFMASFGYAVG